MVADKDKSEAFQVECLSSRESPMNFALLHFALDLTSLLVMPSTDQHWPVHSSRESSMHFALLNIASLLSGHHFTSRLVMPSTDLICTDQCTAAESHQCILHYQLLHFVFSLVFALDFTCFLCNLLICTDQERVTSDHCTIIALFGKNFQDEIENLIFRHVI